MGLGKTFRRVKKKIHVTFHSVKAFRKKSGQDGNAVTGTGPNGKSKEADSGVKPSVSGPEVARVVTAENTAPERAAQQTIPEERPIVALDEQEPVLRILSGDSIDTQWQEFINQAPELITNVVVSGQTVTWQTPRFFGCTFSTGSIQQAFEVPRIGNIDDDIVLGLETVGSAATNLIASSLLSAFDVKTDDAAGVIRSILEALSVEAAGALPEFNIAAFDGLRNGSWMRLLNQNTVEVFPRAQQKIIRILSIAR